MSEVEPPIVEVADVGKWLDCPSPLLATRVAEIAGGLSGEARPVLMAAAYLLVRKITDERVREIAREEVRRERERAERAWPALTEAELRSVEACPSPTRPSQGGG